MATAVATREELDELLSNGKRTIIKFGAKWCGPCKKCAPAFDAMAKSHASDPQLQFLTVDMDADAGEHDVATSVSSLPEFSLFDTNGKRRTRVIGAKMAAVEALCKV